jgi:hypothetical protein
MSDITKCEAERMFKKKFNKDLYLEKEDNTIVKIFDKTDILLAIKKDTLYGQDEVECILIGNTMKDIQKVML